MTSLRSSRSLSNLQVSSLRFNQQDIPAGGGVLVVGVTGAAVITNSVTLTSLDVSSITVSNISATNIVASALDVSGLTAATADIAGLSATNIVASALDVSGLTAQHIVTTAITATGITASGITASGITTSGITAGTAVFTGDITAQDVYVLGSIQALDVSARYFDISGLAVGGDVDVSGELRVDLSATIMGPATFLNTVDASGQAATFGSVIAQSDLSAGALYVTGGATMQTLDVQGAAIFDTATMNTLNVRDIYIQNEIVDVSLGQISQLLIDNILAGSSGATTHAFATGYPLDVSGGLRVGDFNNTYLRITPGTAGRTALEPIGAVNAGIDIIGDLSANNIVTQHVTATGVSANELDVSGVSNLRAGVRVLTGAAQTTGFVAATAMGAGYADTNVVRLFGDATSGATLGPLTLPAGSVGPNGAALVWNHPDLSGGTGNVQLVVGTGNGGSGHFNVYTGITQNPVPVGTQPQMSLDASGTLTLTGSLDAQAIQTRALTMTAYDVSTQSLTLSTLIQNAPDFNQMLIGTNLGTDNYNSIVEEGDMALLFRQTASPSGGNLVVAPHSTNHSGLRVSSAGAVTVHGDLAVVANGGVTQSANYDVVFENAPAYNQLKIGTNLATQTDSPLVSAGDIGILFNRAGTNTGNLVLGLQTGGTGTPIGLRISDTGLVYIGQNVQVPGVARVDDRVTIAAAPFGSAGERLQVAGNALVRPGAVIGGSGSTDATLTLNNANAGNGSPQTLTVNMSGASGFLSDAIINTTAAGVAAVPDIVFQTGGTERMRIDSATGFITGNFVSTSYFTVTYKVAGAYAYTTSGTSSDIYNVTYTAMGGGGGGGGNGNGIAGSIVPPFGPGGGGGSGYFIEGQFIILGGQTILIGVGAGGAGGAYNTAGTAGSQTGITVNGDNIFTVNGGSGGAAGSGSSVGAGVGGAGGYGGGGGGSTTSSGSSTGAAGGTGQTLPYNTISTNGANGGNGNGSVAGNGGRGALGGAGGIGSSNGGGGGGGGGIGGGAGGSAQQIINPPLAQNGFPASQPGAGGGGGAGSGSGAQCSGGAGSAGYITLTFIKMP